ncbi:MAG: DUF6448 family protein [Ignavibacteriaceae bacterium]
MKKTFLVILVLIFLTIFSRPVSAHCDGWDGPVVKAAIKSLETENINHVLIWIQKKNEAEITKAFNEALSVRKLAPKAKELADKYFFETVVRIHREGEGAPYDGLKPAGRDLGPAITSADKVLEGASYKNLMTVLNEAVEEGVHSALHELLEKKDFDVNDVQAGRDFVAAYVTFIHKVENIYESAGHKDVHSAETHKH